MNQTKTPDEIRLEGQQHRADKIRKQDFKDAKRDRWIKWIVVIVVLGWCAYFLFKPVTQFIKDKVPALSSRIGFINDAPQLDAPTSTRFVLAPIDFETATPEEIEAYAAAKREAQQAAEIAQREREKNEQLKAPASLSDLGKLKWDLDNLTKKQSQDFKLLDGRINQKVFDASNGQTTIDPHALVDAIKPLLIKEILDTPEGRDWLEQTIAWYVKRDIERFHPHKSRE